ncbi:phage holin family protein [Sphingomonas aliaeris]|uniref:Phage holin family protein n=1 Tax=Sphingomonas aliaeris TaxID=2759526 RepID=A0A974NVQ7_9SPHN|nr:phage holin family protein [Sphingomonas aliaeris]QQV77944.1 phage holin family protein [Sphingomonas aliaeris]
MSNADPRAPHTLGEIAGGLAGDVQDLVKGELALARAEFDEKLHGLLGGGISLVGGALVAFAGLVVLLEGGAAILAMWIPDWAALLIVGAVIILVGGLIARGGLAKLSLKNITPDRTTASLSKDARILKEHL